MNSSEWHSFTQKAMSQYATDMSQYLREPKLEKFTKSPLSSPSWLPESKEAKQEIKPMSLLQLAEACQPMTEKQAKRVFDRLIDNFENSSLWRLKPSGIKERAQAQATLLRTDKHRQEALVSELLANVGLLRELEKNLKIDRETLWFPINSGSLQLLSLFIENAPWRKNQHLENLRRFLLFKVINDRMLRAGDMLHLVATIGPNDYLDVTISCGSRANRLWAEVFKQMAASNRFPCADLFFIAYNAKARLPLVRKLIDLYGSYFSDSEIEFGFTANFLGHSLFTHSRTGIQEDYAVSYSFPYLPPDYKKLSEILQRAAQFSTNKGLFLSFDFSDSIELRDAESLIQLLPAAQIVTRLLERNLITKATLVEEKIELQVQVADEGAVQELMRQIEHIESGLDKPCIWKYQLPGQGDQWLFYRRPIQRSVSRKFLF